MSTAQPTFRPVLRVTAILFLTALLMGCGDSATEPEPDPTVDGSWSGPVGSDVTLNIVLSEADDGSVSGSGAFAGSTESVAVTVLSGTHSYPNLSLVLGQQGYEDVNLSGTVAASYIEARLNGSGFTNDEVILAKR